MSCKSGLILLIRHNVCLIWILNQKTYFKKKSVHSNFAMKKTFKRITHSLNANIYRFHFEKKHYADNQYIINTGNCRPKKRLKLNSQLPLKLQLRVSQQDRQDNDGACVDFYRQGDERDMKLESNLNQNRSRII